MNQLYMYIHPFFFRCMSLLYKQRVGRFAPEFPGELGEG